MDLRNKIIASAAVLFKTYGIKSVTMDILASDLGISKRTIYEVFSDKDELLVGVVQWMNEMQKELVSRVLSESENAIVAIFKLLEINSNHFQEMSPAFQADIRKFHYQAILKKADKYEFPDFSNNLKIIEKGINDSLFREDIDPELVNRSLYLLGRAIMDNELFPFEQFSRNAVMRNLLINYLRGISTSEGNELINRLELKYK